MSNPVTELGKLLEAAGATVQFGLRAQGHLPTIERMLTEGASWHAIGRAIGWDKHAACEHYAIHMRDEIARLDASLAEAQRYWIDTNLPCGDLPEGWKLDIRLERHAGDVVLFDPEGHEVPVELGDLTLKEQVAAAVARARLDAALGGRDA